MKFSLPGFAMKRPISVLMAVITCLTLGGIAWSRIPLEFLPKIDFPFIICMIPYPGATPEQVENEVAVPAEGEFRTLSQLRRISTVSNSDGCMVRLHFDYSADMALASAEVRDRMERLKLVLPPAVDRMILQRWSSDSLPVMFFSLTSDRDYEEFSYLTRTVIKSRILRLDGVADVQIYGKPEREVLVEFDQQELKRRGIGLYDAVRSLQESALNISAGELTEGRAKHFVRVLDEYRSPEEVGRLLIGSTGIRVDDVANVAYTHREQQRDFLLDGKEGVVLLVRKESESNTVDVCERIHSELDALQREPDFDDIEAFVFFDQSDMITGALGSLMDAGRYGGLLAVVVLFFFLRRLRPTLLVAAAIPASVVVALVVMFFSSLTLNVVTMIAIIIALGMLVDNSIVVIENIYRYNQLGLKPKESALRGSSEVGLAITASTLTTLVVFVPILYMEGGQMSIYMRQFGFPVVSALVASLVIALSVIPLAASYMPELGGGHSSWVRRTILRAGHGKRTGFFGALGRMHPLERLIDSYAGVLAWSQQWRLASIVIIAAVVGITVAWPMQQLSMQQVPESDQRQVHIDLRFEQNVDMGGARRIAQALIAEIDERREELGIRNIFSDYGPGSGQLILFLVQPDELAEGEEPPYSTEEVRDILWKSLPKRVPGAEVRFQVAEMEEGDRKINLRLRGDESQMVYQYAEALKDRLAANVPQLDEITTDRERQRREIRLEVDEVLAAQNGVTPLVVAQTVDFALRGIRLPYMKTREREVPVWAQFREEDRKTRANLENVNILTQQGGLVPLSRLVEFRKAASPEAIRRENGKIVTTLSASTASKDLTEVTEQMKRVIKTFDLPRGYTVEFGENIQELDRDLWSFVTALLLSCVLIYLLMGALFESYLLPFSILWSIPAAFVGVVWIMWLTGTSFDTVSLIGMILMTGIVVNNGIVIIDHINQLRDGGMSRFDAIVQAGRDRFRPVMMTALTTILGCVPIALGGLISAQVVFEGLGRTLIGGLATGTVLTLIVVPLVYSLIDDARDWLSNFAATLFGIFRTA